MSVRVAVLGTGWGSRVQIPVFRRAGLEVVSVWSPTPAHAERAARHWSVERAERDWQAAIGRPDVDLVSIVTPPETHCPISLAALEAGKHVLCEKPTALDRRQAERMAAAAAARPDRLALIDHELRFEPLRRELRRLVADGWVGTPLHAEACFLGGGRLGGTWPWDWWSRASRGGGILGAAGSHLIDQLQWLLGRRVTRVRARLAVAFPRRDDPDGAPRPVTADEIAGVELELEGGVIGTLTLSSVVAGRRVHRMRVAGTAGSLALEDAALVGWRPGAKEPERFGVATAPELGDDVPRHEWSIGTFFLARALAAGLERGDRTALREAADFAAGAGIQRVLDAARESDRSGGWVDTR